MLDLKEILKETKYSFFVPFIGNQYSVTTIGDFLESKDLVRANKTFLPMGVFMYNSAIIFFDSSVVFNKIDKFIGKMSDLSNSFEFKMDEFFLDLQKKKPIEDGSRVYKLVTSYTPHTEKISIIDYKTQGPLSPEKSLEKTFSEKSKLSFGFS